MATAAIGIARVDAGVPLWRDEAVTAVAVSRSFPHLLGLVVHGDEAGMGSYFVGLKVWSALGSGDRTLRCFSVLGGVVAVVALALLVGRHFGRTAAWLSGLLLVTNPTFLYFLTELRSYSWVMAASVVSTALVLHATTSGARRWYVGYGVVVGIGLGLHLGFALVVAAQVAGVLAGRRHVRRSVTGLALAGLIAVLLLAPLLPAAAANSSQVSWIPALDVPHLTSSLWGLAGTRAWGLLIISGLTVFIATRLRLRDGSTIGAATLVVFLAAVVPPVGLALVSVLKPMFIPRYMVGAVPFLAACAGIGVASIRVPARAVRWLAAVVAALALTLFAANSPFHKSEIEDLRGAATFLDAHRRPGDVVLFFPTYSRSALIRYWRDSPTADIAVRSWDPDRVQALEVPTSVLVARLRGHRRIWLVGYEHESWHRFPEPVAPLLPLLRAQPTLDLRHFGSFDVRLLPVPLALDP